MRKIYLSLMLASLTAVCASGRITSHISQDMSRIQTESPFATPSQGLKTDFTPTCPEFTIVKGSERMNAPMDEPLTMSSYQMSRNDSVYFISWGTNVAQGRFSSRVGDIIVGSDGSFYLQDPIISQRIGTWMKGELADGVVSFSLPQPIAYAQFEDGTVTKLIVNVIEQQENTFVPVEGETELRFTWDNGSLKSIDPTVKIGLVLENTGDWTGYADWDIDMAIQLDKASAYDGYAEALDYGMSGFDYNFLYCQTLAFGIKVRFDADRVILSDMPGAPAGSVVIGSLDGDKVSFPTQYLGIDSVNMCHVYFQPLNQHLSFDGGYIYPENTCIDAYSLTFDRDTMTFHADEDNAYSINCGKGDLLTIDTRGMLYNADFRPFDRNRPATPSIGQVYMYANSNPDWGFACFAHPLMDVDGGYLDPEQLYYRIYMDDELQNLDTSIYTGFDTDEPTVTDIPFLFSNGANIFAFNWNYMHQISTFVAWEKFGVQMVYKAGGEERLSDIFNSDQTSTPSSVRVVNDADHGMVLDSVYRDMSGRVVVNPGRGVYVRTDTFADGYVKSVKVVL